MTALVLVFVVSLAPPVRYAENVMVSRYLAPQDGAAGAIVNAVVHVCDPEPYAALTLLLVLVALLRRGWGAALVVLGVLSASATTTQILKRLLATERSEEWLQPQVDPGSWPSGHATAAMALALCAVLVTGPRHRRVAAACGAVFVAVLAWATMAFGGHFASDLLGGYLVAAFWASVGLCWLLWRLDGAALRSAR